MNLGLDYTTPLKEGKFLLYGGVEKVQKNVWFFMSFIGWFRVYYEDYVPDILPLVQKPISYIQTFKVLILGRLKATVVKYLPDIALNSLDFGIKDRNSVVFVLDYTPKGVDSSLISLEPVLSATFISV
jgi:hypothetical protein